MPIDVPVNTITPISQQEVTVEVEGLLDQISGIETDITAGVKGAKEKKAKVISKVNALFPSIAEPSNIPGKITPIPSSQVPKPQKISKSITSFSPIFAAVLEVETKGLTNRFIRTKTQPKDPVTGKILGSNAYGPMQITIGLINDLATRKPDLFDNDDMAFIEQMRAQAKKFNEFGGTGLNDRYDYGGEGDLNTPTARKSYFKLSEKIWKEKIGNETDPDQIAAIWHGSTDDKLNKRYADKLRKELVRK